MAECLIFITRRLLLETYIPKNNVFKVPTDGYDVFDTKSQMYPPHTQANLNHYLLLLLVLLEELLVDRLPEHGEH